VHGKDVSLQDWMNHFPCFDLPQFVYDRNIQHVHKSKVYLHEKLQSPTLHLQLLIYLAKDFNIKKPGEQEHREVEKKKPRHEFCE
jgi:hypothetical protein